MTRHLTVTRLMVAWLLVATVGCGGGGESVTGPPAPTIGPANITIVSATQTSIHLRNSGGPGSYRLELWGRVTTNIPAGYHVSQLVDGRCPVTAVKIWEFEPVDVLAGYDEAFTITATSATVYGYKVFTRPVNTAIYTQSDCRRAVEGAWLTFTC